eukprot:gene8160-5689_t
MVDRIDIYESVKKYRASALVHHILTFYYAPLGLFVVQLMSMEDTLWSVLDAAREQSPITTVVGRSSDNNLPCYALEYNLPCTDIALDEIGESCRTAFYTHDYHVLLCTLRVCLVHVGGQSFYIPPLESPVIDASVVPLETNSGTVLLLIAVKCGLHAFLLSFSDPPRVSRKLFLKTHKKPVRIHPMPKLRFAVCFQSGEIGTYHVRLTEDGDLECDETPTSGEGWTSKSYLDSFHDPHTRSLLVLTNKGVDLWMASPSENGTLCMEQRDTIKCPEEGACVVPSPHTSYLGYIVFRSGKIAPLSLVAGAPPGATATLLLQPFKQIPPHLTLKGVTCAASAKAITALYSSTTQSLGILVEGCANLSTFQQEDALTLLNLDTPVCAIAPGPQDDLVAYHPNGKMSRISRISNGEQLRRLQQQEQNPHRLCAGLPTAFASRAWVEAMRPVMVPDPAGPLVWHLSSGALGCTYFFGGLVRHLFKLYSSPLLQTDEEDAAHVAAATALRQVLLNAYHTAHQLLGEGGWSSCVVYLLDPIEWKGTAIHGAATAQMAQNAQAAYLLLLLRAVFRALGHTCLRRLAQTVLHSEPPLPPTPLLERTEVDWLQFLAAPSMAAWERIQCRELLRFLLSRAKGQDPVAEAAAEQEEEQTEGQTLVERIKEAAYFQPVPYQLAVHIHLQVLYWDFEAALKFTTEHFTELYEGGEWDWIAAVLEEYCPDQLFPAVRLALHQYYHVESDDEAQQAMQALLAALDRVDPSTAGTVLAALQHALGSVPTAPHDAGAVARLQGRYHTFLSSLVQWMGCHALLDPRVPIFEQLLASSEGLAPYARPPSGPTEEDGVVTGAFLRWCTYATVQGSRYAAAEGIASLAYREERLPLAERLHLCERALRLLPPPSLERSQAIREAIERQRYFLLLQQRLLGRLEKHWEEVKGIAAEDADQLQHVLLNEPQLYTLASKYRAVGGAVVQLDILKLREDASSVAVADALRHALAYVCGAGKQSATEAVARLLGDAHLTQGFRAPFPVEPLIEFLVFDQSTRGERVCVPAVARHLLDCNIHAKAREEEEEEAPRDGASTDPLQRDKWQLQLQREDLMRAMELVVQSVPAEFRPYCEAHMKTLMEQIEEEARRERERDGELEA